MGAPAHNLVLRRQSSRQYLSEVKDLPHRYEAGFRAVGMTGDGEHMLRSPPTPESGQATTWHGLDRRGFFSTAAR